MLQSKEGVIKYVVIIFVILILVLIGVRIIKEKTPEKIVEKQKEEIFANIDKNINVNVTKYMIYGTHFNIEGNANIVKISGIKINNVSLVVKKLNGEEMRYKF